MFLVLAAVVPFDATATIRPGQTFTIRDVNGTVRVRDGDRLAIHATKRAERSDPAAVAIRVETRADGVVVCVRYPPDTNAACGERGSARVHDNDTVVDFDVTVPHGVNVEASSVNGPVDVAVDAAATAASVNGAVTVDARDVRSAKSVNGSVSVVVRDRSRGALDAVTVNGSIDIALPSGTGVALDARTLTGDIDADGFTVSRPRYGPGARASGTAGDGSRRVTLKTVNGSITLHEGTPPARRQAATPG